MSLPAFPVLLGLRLVPDAVHAQVVAQVLNRLLRGQAIERRLPELEGKSIDIEISDAPCTLRLRVAGSRIHARTAKPSPCDVRIRGSLTDYWKLATRTEDPDTLFFARRLSLEGDTETALYIKNLLDAMEFDWQTHAVSMLGPHAGTAVTRLVRSFAAASPAAARRPK
ncbi:MAG: ubiquinone anaerobic biosynthesis accessory factor UbiT [Acidiferrobacterales bacterium]